MHPHVDPLDQKLHDPRLLGREQFVPQWVELRERLSRLVLGDFILLGSRGARCARRSHSALIMCTSFGITVSIRHLCRRDRNADAQAFGGPPMDTIRTIVVAAGIAGAAAATAVSQPVFFSTNAQPLTEVQVVHEQVLAALPSGVDYQMTDREAWLARVRAEVAAGHGSIGLLAAMHADVAAVSDGLADLNTIGIDTEEVAPSLMKLGRLGTGEQKYVPWMHSSYLMAANVKALDYLPAGTELDTLTYDGLLAWIRALAEATGDPKFGLPAGGPGHFRRFVQGYLLPAYTGATVTQFRSDAAVEAWEMLRNLWAVTNTGSSNYFSMQAPLLTEEVWIAWDHAVRLSDAFNQRPGDFVAFPAPAGPAGRPFMTMIAGLAVPATTTDSQTAASIIATMLAPETQIATLRATNYFPVVDVDFPVDLPPAVRATGAAIQRMVSAPDALPVVPPPDFVDLTYRFSDVYVETFDRILYRGEDIRTVLDSEAENLRRVMNEPGVPCWAPDPPSLGPCPVN